MYLLGKMTEDTIITISNNQLNVLENNLSPEMRGLAFPTLREKVILWTFFIIFMIGVPSIIINLKGRL